MNQPPQAQDPQVPKAFLELMNSQEEFPLNVEGVRAIPHASSVVSVDLAVMQVVLKMLRPLAAELPQETLCKVSIGALGEFWKAMLKYQGRVKHLQYLFDLPKTMEKVGRREHKRYPFRPRENVTVYLQDSGLPGLGAVGTLLDLSLGGLAFRPERAFRIEDGARLRLDTILFQREKKFPVVRIDGLPKLSSPLRLRGEVAHVFEKKGIIFVALVFGLLDAEQEETLAKVLQSRERGGSEGGAPHSSAAATAAPETSPKSAKSDAEAAVADSEPDAKAIIITTEIPEQEEAHKPLPEPLMRLARRTNGLLLVKPGGASCDDLIKSLKEVGYVRLEQCDGLDSHHVQTMPNINILLISLEAGGNPNESLPSFRNIHSQLKLRDGQAAVVIAERYDPILVNSSKELSLPIGFTSSQHWLKVIDNELDLVIA